jgi:hypothetical protein
MNEYLNCKIIVEHFLRWYVMKHEYLKIENKGRLRKVQTIILVLFIE